VLTLPSLSTQPSDPQSRRLFFPGRPICSFRSLEYWSIHSFKTSSRRSLDCFPGFESLILRSPLHNPRPRLRPPYIPSVDRCAQSLISPRLPSFFVRVAQVCRQGKRCVDSFRILLLMRELGKRSGRCEEIFTTTTICTIDFG
jgi:hypothetical protein